MRYHFEVTQPPGGDVVVEGEASNLSDAIATGAHYLRMYAQDGRCRLTVTDSDGEVYLMSVRGTCDG